MICRKCGANIPDNSIRCVHCGIKVNILCPECNTINPFGSKNCQNCNFELLKTCQKCNTINMFSATKCRKCGESLPLPKCDKNIDESYIENLTNEQDIVSSFSSIDINFSNTAETIKKYQAVNKKEEGNNHFFNFGENQSETNEDDIFTNELQSSDNQAKNDEKKENEEKFIDSEIEITPIDPNVKIEFLQDENDDKEEDVTDIEIEEKLNIQEKERNKIIACIKSSISNPIIAINGPEGSGKTALLKQVSKNLTGSNFVFLYGSCTPLVQITSFGFFQDAFLRIMGFPPYTKSVNEFLTEFQKSNYSKLFASLTKREMNTFLNIFYPSTTDSFENIIKNKENMFNILEKVIKSFSINSNLIITIDNFDLLDGASYEFIVHLIKKGYLKSRIKLLAAYQEQKPIQSFFDTSEINEKMFKMITLKKLTNEEMLTTIKCNLNMDITKLLPENYLNELMHKSNGNALRFEQELALLFGIGYISVKNNEIIIKEENKPEIQPANFEELVKLRLNTLTPSARNVLYLAAIMGYRFSTNILYYAVTMPAEKAQKAIEYLKQELFLDYVDNYTCEFKSLALWKLVYQEAKNDLLYKENAEKLYQTLKPLTLSSNLQKLISCTEAIGKSEAFMIWKDTSYLSASLGDTNLYVISQKQCLKIIEEQEIDNAEHLKNTIYEQIGKLLCDKSPCEAVTYLSNVLDTEIKECNIIRIIDLSGYFVKSCYLSGNYTGAVEAVDAVLSALKAADISITPSDLALIKSRKLKALLNIGNCEEIINLIKEEILPNIEKATDEPKIDNNYKNLLIDSVMLSKTCLAKALAMQGNNEALNVVNSLREDIVKYEYFKDYFTLQAEILEAFTHTISGDINKSNETLNTISVNYKNAIIEPDLLAEWNLINIINRILLNEKENLKADLFELAAFANNINEHFIKNIIKLILGYVLKQEKNTEKAMEIFNEQITYFAKEKVATGALSAWLLMVQIYINTGDDEKALNTATKSLEIAQSPKINNYIFIIYFQKFIAEIYLRKGDLTAAKMYLEKSVIIAKQFDLKYQLIELYLAYGEYMQELIRLSKKYLPSNITLTTEMYNKAVVTAKELRIKNLMEKALKARNEFKTLCKLHS